jgi:hypothetical protein
MHTIEAIGREKGLDPEVIIQAMEEAYAAASRKYYKSREDFGARFDRESGVFAVFSRQVVVEDDDVAGGRPTAADGCRSRRRHRNGEGRPRRTPHADRGAGREAGHLPKGQRGGTRGDLGRVP